MTGKKPSIVLEATGHYQTPVVITWKNEDILRASEEIITDKIFGLCKSRSIRWAKEKAIQLKAAAVRIRKISIN